MARPPLAALLLAAASVVSAAGAQTTKAGSSSKDDAQVDLKRLTPAERHDAIRRAAVWRATEVAAMDLRKGPQGPRAFEREATITCAYLDRPISGASPKFECALGPDDEIKVKYGRQNGEVYGEVAATRLLWALGFGADHMYPVHVVCSGCPPRLPAGRREGSNAFFDTAAVERKMPGEEMESPGLIGWSWRELDDVDETAGGAPPAERDALKLLAVFLQHTDSKPEQQRLMCESSRAEIEAAGGCPKPFMMINDLGLTFGSASTFNKNELSGANFERWSRMSIWKDAEHCIGNLPKSQTGTLRDPVISEAGRQFLADLMVQLSEGQVRDLFEVARFPLRARNGVGDGPGASVDEWVEAFDAKRDEIVNHVCP